MPLVLAAALLAGGATAVAAPGPSGDRVPNYVEVTTDGAVIIQAAPAWDNPEGCLDPERIFIPGTNALIDRFYATVLTAYAGGSFIWAYIEGCQLMPWGEEYGIVKNIAIRRR